MDIPNRMQTIFSKVFFAIIFTATCFALYAAFRWLAEPVGGRYRRFETFLTSAKKTAATGGESQGTIEISANSFISRRIEIRNPQSNALVAIISKAAFDECGVLTGDYEQKDRGHPHYIDYVNGWERGQCCGKPGLRADPEVVINAAARHFGVKGIEVTNAFGPSRNFRLERGRDYVASAWMKQVWGDVALERGMVIEADYRRQDLAAQPWPIRLTDRPVRCSGELKVERHDDGWCYIEIAIPASKDLTHELWREGYRFVRLWIGAPNGDGHGGDATVYIDDIRFYPADSEARSFYYADNPATPMACVGTDNSIETCNDFDL